MYACARTRAFECEFEFERVEGVVNARDSEDDRRECERVNKLLVVSACSI